jgi:hypothetical protein
VRALSIRQPWAELIARGKKKTEHRTWSRNFRGDLLVVASAARQDVLCKKRGLDPDALAYGVAVCIVDFWKVTEDDLLDYNSHFRNPRRVRPVRVKGYASIFHVEDDLIEVV